MKKVIIVTRKNSFNKDLSHLRELPLNKDKLLHIYHWLYFRDLYDKENGLDEEHPVLTEALAHNINRIDDELIPIFKSKSEGLELDDFLNAWDKEHKFSDLNYLFLLCADETDFMDICKVINDIYLEYCIDKLCSRNVSPYSFLYLKDGKPCECKGNADTEVIYLWWDEIYISEKKDEQEKCLTIEKHECKNLIEALCVDCKVEEVEHPSTILFIHDKQWGGLSNVSKLIYRNFGNKSDLYRDEKFLYRDLPDIEKLFSCIVVFQHTGVYWEQIKRLKFDSEHFISLAEFENKNKDNEAENEFEYVRNEQVNYLESLSLFE